jgi:hypothetical protein
VEGGRLAGLVTNPTAGDRLFADFAESWIEHRLVKGRPLRPATCQGYRALLRRHLGPAFGAMKLRQITPERIRQWQTDLNARSPDQAAKAYRVLRAIMNTAVSDEVINRNPCSIRGAGIERTRKRPLLDTTTVLALADTIEPKLRCLVLLRLHSEAAGGIEPPYGALQLPKGRSP